MNDTPTPTELLAAVSRFMRDEVMPALTGATAYQARVAANMLDIASRQLALAQAQDAEELKRLRTLLGSDVELAEGTRLLGERRAVPARGLGDEIRVGRNRALPQHRCGS